MVNMKPKLTLRDLFWLVLVAACLCGWWINRQQWMAREQELGEAYSQLHEEVIRLSMACPGVTKHDYSTFRYTVPAPK